MTASVLGPFLVRALEQSSLRDSVANASRQDRAVTVTTYLDTSDQTPLGTEAVTEVLHALDDRTTGEPLWSAPVLSAQSQSNLGWRPAAGTPLRSVRVSSAGDRCRGYVVSAGRCPQRPGEVMLSGRDAATAKLAVGGAAGATIVVVLPDARVVRWQVVGTYDADRTAQPLVTRPGSDSGTYAVSSADSVVVDVSQLEALGVGVRVEGTLQLDRPLAVGDDDRVREQVGRLRAAALAQQRQLVVQSGLLAILADTSRQSRAAGVLVAVTAVQALVLALLATAAVMSRIGRSRAPEWAVDRLRGLSRRRWLSTVFAEPLAASALGLVLGFGAGALIGRAVVSAVLDPAIPIEPWRQPVLLGAAGAVLGVVLALTAASLPILRRQLASQLREGTEAAVDGPLVLIVQVLVVSVAGAAVYQLLAGGVLSSEGPQLGLVAPSLLALAFGVVAARVAVQAVRFATRRPPRGLTGLVVVRHAARVPSALVPSLVTAVAVSLAVFATQVPVLSARNQDLRADVTVGAATVLHVRVPPGKSLLELVRAADPEGRSAMAVEERNSSADGGTSRVVAVDTARMAAVSTWRTTWSGVPDLTRALDPPTASPATFRGDRLDVTLQGATVVPAFPGRGTDQPEPSLGIVLESGDQWVTSDLGAVDTRGGRLTSQVPCAQGCRVVGFSLKAEGSLAYDATVVITALTVDGQDVPALTGLLHGGPWVPRVGNLTNPLRVTQITGRGSPNGLYLSAEDDTGDLEVRLLAPDAVDPPPAILGPGTDAESFAGFASAVRGTGFDGQAQLLSSRGRAAVLPRSLDDGVLVDLAHFRTLSPPASDQALPEVWLAAGASPAITQRLVAAGVVVQGRKTAAAERARLARAPASLGAVLGIPLAVVALLLALLTLVASRAVDIRRRRSDWTSLRAAGLDGRRVRRLARLEIAAPPLLAVLLGAVGGWVAMALAAPRLPIVDLASPGPPLDLHQAWMPLALVVVCTALAVALVAEVGARVETRSFGGGRR